MSVIAATLILAGCAGAGEDDCARRIMTDAPIPAEGCCTEDGLCVQPPEYDAALCGGFTALDCLPYVYEPVYEGGPRWVLCPPGDDGPTSHEPCPLDMLAP